MKSKEKTCTALDLCSNDKNCSTVQQLEIALKNSHKNQQAIHGSNERKCSLWVDCTGWDLRTWAHLLLQFFFQLLFLIIILMPPNRIGSLTKSANTRPKCAESRAIKLITIGCENNASKKEPFGWALKKQLQRENKTKHKRTNNKPYFWCSRNDAQRNTTFTSSEHIEWFDAMGINSVMFIGGNVHSGIDWMMLNQVANVS